MVTSKRVRPEMSESASQNLALLRQYFEELVALTPMSELSEGRLGSGAKRLRVVELLKSIYSVANHLNSQLSGMSASKPPVLTLSPGLIEFYRNEFQPHRRTLTQALADADDLWSLFLNPELQSDDLGDENFRRAEIRQTIQWSLERWVDGMDGDEVDDWLARGFPLRRTVHFVEEPLFAPDSWLDNRKLLEPILLDKPPERLPSHVRHRLVEIYGSFYFGLWMSCIALCRSTIEFTLKNRKGRLGIEDTVRLPGGRVVEKRLAELIDETSSRYPQIKDDLDRVREAGNRVLHPKKRDVIAMPGVVRREALDCVASTRKILEIVYATM